MKAEEREKDVSSMGAYLMPGKHLPKTDDVSVLFLLRCVWWFYLLKKFF